MHDEYQQVIVTLSDGRVGTFVGKVLIAKDEVGELTIVETAFTEPKPLPEDMHFEEIEFPTAGSC